MRRLRTLTVNVSPAEFLQRLKKKIDMYNSEDQSTLFTSPPYIDYSGININGNKLIIEKGNKLLDGTSSPYFSFWGSIYVEIKEDNKSTKLIASFGISTATQDFVVIACAIGLSMSAIMFMMLNPSWFYSLLILLGGGIIFFVIKSSQERYSENFESYLKGLIEEKE